MWKTSPENDFSMEEEAPRDGVAGWAGAEATAGEEPGADVDAPCGAEAESEAAVATAAELVGGAEATDLARMPVKGFLRALPMRSSSSAWVSEPKPDWRKRMMPSLSRRM